MCACSYLNQSIEHNKVHSGRPNLLKIHCMYIQCCDACHEITFLSLQNPFIPLQLLIVMTQNAQNSIQIICFA